MSQQSSPACCHSFRALNPASLIKRELTACAVMLAALNRVPGPGRSDAECRHFPHPLHGPSAPQQLPGDGGTGAA